MDDPTPRKTRVTEEDIFPGPIEWLADVRSFHAEQRAKYGMDWEAHRRAAARNTAAAAGLPATISSRNETGR